MDSHLKAELWAPCNIALPSSSSPLHFSTFPPPQMAANVLIVCLLHHSIMDDDLMETISRSTNFNSSISYIGLHKQQD